MQHYVGLDASLTRTANCIIDRTRQLKRKATVDLYPEASGDGS